VAKLTEPFDFEALTMVPMMPMEPMTGNASPTTLTPRWLFQPFLVDRVIDCGPCFGTFGPFAVGQNLAESNSPVTLLPSRVKELVVTTLATREVSRGARSALLDIEAANRLSARAVPADFALDLQTPHGSTLAVKGETFNRHSGGQREDRGERSQGTGKMIASTDPIRVRSLIAGAQLYAEYVGGLGDAILRMYLSGDGWYGPLERLTGRDHAVVVLMCHNPYLAEVFQWHPKQEQIHVVDLGFTTPFHPWENPGWRIAHGLPQQAPCPPHLPAKTLQFFPSPEDSKILAELRTKKYVIMCATAGTREKTIPAYPREIMASAAVEAGFEVAIVGRSKYFFGERREDVRPRQGIMNLVDRLSVPGVAEAVKTAAGIISADTSVLHMAWQEHRPVFLLYNRWCLENLVSRGPVGYMQGIERPDTDHMEFSAFNADRFRKWIGARG
jgi:hypothetical protein